MNACLTSRRRALLGGVLAGMLVFLAGCTSLPPLPRDALAFGVMGDTPYSAREVALLDDMIERINAEELAFVVHIGDITSGRGPCTDDWFLARKAQFNRVRHPMLVIPGDNDWMDCHRSGMEPMERLARFRQIFLAEDAGLGRRPMKVERQSARAGHPAYPAYPEHMRWTTGRVLFITLNVQGGNDNLGRTQAMDAEHHQRRQAVLAWLAEAGEIVSRRNLAGLVILTQANPEFEQSQAGTGRPDGYASLREALRGLVTSLNRPVVFVHGDTHLYQQDHPLRDAAGEALRLFTRVEVPGSPFIGWVRGIIHPEGAHPVSMTRAPAR